MPDIKSHSSKAVNHSSVLVCLGHNGNVLDANETFYWLAGCTPDVFKSKYKNNVLNLVAPEDVQQVSASFMKQINAGNEINLKFRFNTSLVDSQETVLTIFAYQTENSDTYFIWMPVLPNDISACLEQFKNIFSLSTATVVEFNKDLVAVYADEAYYSLIGYTCEEYEEKFGSHIIPSAVLRKMMALHKTLPAVLPKKQRKESTFCIPHKNGSDIWISIHASRVDAISGIIVYRWIIEDITSAKIADDENKNFHLINDLANDISINYDIKNDILTLSQNYTKITGLPNVCNNFQKIILNRNFIASESMPAFLEVFYKAVTGKPCSPIELCLIKSNGSSSWVNLFCTTVYNDYNIPIMVIGKLTNIDSIKKERDILVNIAERDPLTKFYNKSKIKQVIDEYIVQNPSSLHAFFMIDIDNFKLINDTLGHLSGDLALTEVCSKINAKFGEQTFLGRIGGDEFVVFLKSVPTKNDVLLRAEEVCDLFSSLKSFHGKSFSITCSVGISLFPDHGNNYNDLFSKADIALYKAKHCGKNCYEFYQKKQRNNEIDPQNANACPSEITSTQIETEPFRNFIISWLKILFVRGNIGENISRVLNMIGMEFDLSRIYIVTKHEETGNFTVPYEWYSSITSSMQNYFNSLTMEDHRQFIEQFDEDGVFFCNDITEISPVLLSRMTNQQIKSSLNCAFYNAENQVIGYIGFDICDGECIWSMTEIDNLLLAARLIGLYAIRNNTRRTRNDLSPDRTSGRSKHSLFYMIQADNYELQYISEKMQKEYPNAQIGMKCYEAFNSKRAEPCCTCPYNQATHFDKEYSINYYNEQANCWICATSSLINWRGASPSVLVTYDNITKYVEKINYNDNLTGLSSLTRFKIDAQHILNGIMKNYAIICINFVNFKDINASLGYEQGDKILRSFARFLKASIKETDLVCRAHDDNFIILTEYLNKDDFKNEWSALSNKIISSIQSLYNLSQIRCTIGVYFLSSRDDQIISAIDKANIARKSFAFQQINGLAFFDEEMGRKYSLQKELEGGMCSALANHEFIVYMQPKIALKGGKIIGAEALVRWDHPTKGILSPIDFIPLFEQNGFIIPLDYEVYEVVCQNLRARLDAGKNVVPVSVNISRLHIQDPDFSNKLIFITQKYNIPVELVEFELTESANLIDAFEELEKLIRVMDVLHQYGFSLSMDDFGSGYSSLSILKDIPVDIIKLDRSFLNSASFSDKVKIVLESIIDMCKKLNIKTLSEGVVNHDQQRMLGDMGCDMAQGFLFARPMPMNDFFALIDK